MDFITSNLDIIGTIVIGVLVLFGVKVRVRAIIGDIAIAIMAFSTAFNLLQEAAADDTITAEEVEMLNSAVCYAWQCVQDVIIAAKSFRQV